MVVCRNYVFYIQRYGAAAVTHYTAEVVIGLRINQDWMVLMERRGYGSLKPSHSYWICYYTHGHLRRQLISFKIRPDMPGQAGIPLRVVNLNKPDGVMGGIRSVGTCRDTVRTDA